MSSSPERRLANRIVEIHDLRPPVDIFKLAKHYANLEVAPWPYDCDGLTIGLTSSVVPSIFIKESSNEPRQRFTVAHELGHVLLPWHIEEVGCTPEQDSTTSFHGGLRENEASTFASHILVPDRFLKPFCSGDIDVPLVLKALEEADISASASLIALTRALPPGIAFVLDADRVIQSRGTVLPTPGYDHLLDGPTWSAESVTCGRFRLRNRPVRWFKFEQFVEPSVVVDPRTNTQLLRDAIAAVTADSIEQVSMLQIVNGVIGAAMTEDNRATAARALATMKHRLKARPDLDELVQQPDFESFLHRRAISHTK